jgi:GNAT superfamily N-acetyltransferase
VRWLKQEECEHRDANITRAIDIEQKSTAAKQKYVDEPFGPNQLYLAMLCTHPDFQLHGAGTRLVSRGIEFGREKDVNVTLIALPTSESFYAHIGFDSFTNFSISSVDENEYFRYDVMGYNFTSQE